MKEEWRDIKGYEGFYKVSSFGRVLSLPKKRNIVVFNKATAIAYTKERILKGRKDKDGYLMVSLSDGKRTINKKIHRLVAEAFLKPIEGKVIINHKNGKKDDNVVTNLEWCTNKENLIHAHHILYSSHHEYYNSRKCSMYDSNMVFIKTFDSLSLAARAINRTKQAVHLNCIGKTRTCAGYKFRYQ